MKFTPFLLCGLLVTAAPVAAGTYDVTGTGMGTLKSEVMPVGDDLTVVHVMTDYTGFESDNPDNPLTSLSGPCFGAVVVKAGQTSGAGNCHYTDAEGDTAVMQWTAESVSAEGRTMGS